MTEEERRAVHPQETAEGADEEKRSAHPQEPAEGGEEQAEE